MACNNCISGAMCDNCCRRLSFTVKPHSFLWSCGFNCEPIVAAVAANQELFPNDMIVRVDLPDPTNSAITKKQWVKYDPDNVTHATETVFVIRDGMTIKTNDKGWEIMVEPSPFYNQHCRNRILHMACIKEYHSWQNLVKRFGLEFCNKLVANPTINFSEYSAPKNRATDDGYVIFGACCGGCN